MSGPSSDPLVLASAASTTIFPVAVLVTSFIGSLHCVGMCGGLVTAVGQSRAAIATYHLGRLAGYCTLGAIAGFAGQKALSVSMYGPASVVAATLMGLAFIGIGLKTWRGKGLHLNLPAPAAKLYSRIWSGLIQKETAVVRSGGVGLLSVFLPCGWLYAFVLAATTTQSAARGAVFLSLFWLGTVPALSVAPALIRRILRPIALKAPIVAGTAFVAIGLATLALKITPALKAHRMTENGSQPAKPAAAEHPPACPYHQAKN